MYSQKFFQPKAEAKVIHYLSNGSGRDSYITRNNGGIFQNLRDNPKGFEIGTFGGKHQHKVINNYLPAKAVHYHSDGTGRDVYIGVDEGGLSSFSWSRLNYIKGLRGYNKIRYATENDCFSKMQFNRPISSAQNIRLIKNQQNKVISRLSQPIIKEDPYCEIRSKSAFPGLRTTYG